MNALYHDIFDAPGIRRLRRGGASLIRRSLPILLLAAAPMLGGALHAQVTYRGISNSALGGAQVQLDGDNLTVSNIGESGNDGLSVSLHRSGGLQLHLPAPNGPDGSSMVSTSYHNDDNVTSSVVTEVANGITSVSADFANLGATKQVVEVYSNGVLVASHEHNGTKPDVTFDATLAWSWYCICTGGDGRDGTAVYIYGGSKAAVAGGLEQTEFTLANGDKVTGDQFRLRPSDETVEILYTSRGDITAKGMTTFTITDEYIAILGQFHKGIGSGSLDADHPKLHVNDIDVAKGGGVQVQLDDAGGFDAHTEAIDLSGANASLTMRAVGDFNGKRSADLGGASIVNNGTDLLLNTFYDGVNAHNVKIEFVNGSDVIGSTVVAAGEVGHIAGTSARVIGCGKVPPRPPIGTSCIWFEMESPASVVAANGTEFTVTTVRLLADDASGPINSLSSYDIEVFNVPAFTITDEFRYDPAPSLGVAAEPAATFTFGGASPNLTHGITTIGYRLDRSGPVRLELLDMRGALVETLEERSHVAGEHTLEYDAAKLPSGTYFLRLTFGAWAATSRLVVVR